PASTRSFSVTIGTWAKAARTAFAPLSTRISSGTSSGTWNSLASVASDALEVSFSCRSGVNCLIEAFEFSLFHYFLHWRLARPSRWTTAQLPDVLRESATEGSAVFGLI